jgi:hypothetical protein
MEPSWTAVCCWACGEGGCWMRAFRWPLYVVLAFNQLVKVLIADELVDGSVQLQPVLTFQCHRNRHPAALGTPPATL